MPTISQGSSSGVLWIYRVWNRSPRVDGKLVLQTLPLSSLFCVRTKYHGGFGAQANCTNSNVGFSHFWSQGVQSQPEGKAAYNMARSRFVRKAWNDAQASVAVDIAERKQTLHMLGSTIARLAIAAIAVRNGDFRRANHALFLSKDPPNLRKPSKRRKTRKKQNADISPSEVFATNWLAYRYGWTPLLSSIDSLAKALDRPIENRFVRASGWADINRSVDANVSGGKATGTIKQKGRARITMKAKAVVSSPTASTLQQYGLVNPLLVAWELVPFSFVADWFLPIGSYLEQLTDTVGLSFSEFSITEAAEVDMRYYQHANYPGLPAGSGFENFVKVKKRYLVSTVPSAHLEYFSNGLNPKRALDAIALLRQTLLKGTFKR